MNVHEITNDNTPGPEAALSAGELLVQHLPLLQRTVRAVSRRYRVDPEESKELLACTVLKLIDHDYAVLRAFRGECSLARYLHVVVQRVLLDRRIASWGKWRPSKRARALGVAAVHIERLVVQERLTPREAIRATVENPQFTLGSHEATSLYRAVSPQATPVEVRLPPSFVEVATPEWGDPSRGVDFGASRRRLRDAFEQAICCLEPEDRHLLKLRFRDGFTVAQVARLVAIDQRLLYRRFERILRHLRAALEARGVRGEDVRRLEGDDAQSSLPEWLFGRKSM